VTSSTRDRTPAARPLARPVMARRPRRVLVGLELFTGATALVGGLLLAIAPDGSLLAADPAALAGSPFADYRWPGVLLATLVGVGYLVTGVWQARSGVGARALSVFAGAGLVVFEASELLWLGFQPLEAALAAIGATVALLAALAPSEPSTSADRARSSTQPGAVKRA
jgi:hypothetical protein